MPILGTKKIWKPAQETDIGQRENQILKNAGYINLQLRAVNYMSKGNFWQDIFGGKDKIALTTSVKYQNSGNIIESTSVQDIREVKVNSNYNFGLQRNLAVKIPANCDAIAIEVKMVAVKNDMLQAKFNMLSQPDYQSALQLAPTVVGQLLTVTSLVKKLFSETDPKVTLEANFAGVISLTSEDQPVANGKLTKGMLIMVSTNEGDKFENVDESKFEFKGDTLYYENRQVENTYLVFNIGFDPLKGDDEKSNWFKKYNEALTNLDKIINYTVGVYDKVIEVEIARILKASIDLWMAGNTLIDFDDTYIHLEKIKIKNAALSAVKQKYSMYMPLSVMTTILKEVDTLKSIVGDFNLKVIEEALPGTGNFIYNELNLIPDEGAEIASINALHEAADQINLLLDNDTADYLSALNDYHIPFKLGQSEIA